MAKDPTTYIFGCLMFLFGSINLLFAQISYEEAFPNISFNFPVEIQSAGDGSDRLFVVEQPGTIKVFPNTSAVTSGQVSTFLDISSRVAYSAGQEIGLLGLAFHPNFSSNRYIYVYFTDQPGNFRINVARYQVDASNQNFVDPSTETLIYSFTKNQSNNNHNGGKIAFGPDGYLYISVGDGGGGFDPQKNAQNLNNPFGSILRIDVDNPSGGNNYGIPGDNPRVGQSGLDELYSWGIRNTWKFSFDGNTMYGADVGQSSIEEINIIENGGNYGWVRFEGNNLVQPGEALVTSPDTKPIFTYDHSNGDVSITGGYVYRGAITNPDIQGKYIYGDYVSGRIWALDYNASNGQVNNNLLFKTNGQFVSSFGLDEAGELYFSNYGNSVKLYKIIDQNSGPVTVPVNGVGAWINKGVPGTNGVVEVIANNGSDEFYVGGEFTTVAGISANNLAKYSKATGWEAVGNGTNGKVSAIDIDSNGNVYVGGSFTQIDGQSVSNIAVWNGTIWSALGSGTDGPVSKIGIAVNNDVYVGGTFQNAGGTLVRNIALWNGSWSALTDATNGISGTNNEIRSIAIDEAGVLYVGGNFDTAGGNSAPRIATWNGTNWGTLGSGTSGFVQAILVRPDYIYAGGNFSIAGGLTVNRMARWNRNTTTWEALDFGLSGNVNTLEHDGTYLYAGGTFETASDMVDVNEVMDNIARWSESNGWEALGTNTNVGVTTVVNSLSFTADGSELCVGGNFSNTGAINADNIAIWRESNGCVAFSITPEYLINGSTDSGENRVEITEGDSFVLGIVQNLYFSITLPDNSTVIGDYDFGIVDSSDSGIYTITSTEGCIETFELVVNTDPNTADDDNDGVVNADDDCPNTPTGESVDANGCSQSQLDDDNDGVVNSVDTCPNTPSGESVDASGCSQTQLDDDNDGVVNADDDCPNTPSGESVTTNGCSDSQLDDDNDGVVNSLDTCPNTPSGESVDANGCSDSQLDDDNDGVVNSQDNCPGTPSGESVDANGCSQSQFEDDDNDGVINGNDLCPGTPSGESVDANGCSQSQLDEDNDGVVNTEDDCPNTPAGEGVTTNGCSDSQLDDDNDGVSNAEDICPNTPTTETADSLGCGPSQQDIDNDGVPNSLDLCNDTPAGETVDANGCSDSQLDDDNDGISNADDICPNTPSGENVNAQGCGDSQLDDDNDGVSNADDICPNTPSNETADSFGCGPSQQDIDNDGVPNASDLCTDTPVGEAVDVNGCSQSQLDDDNDGVVNSLDRCPGTLAGTLVDNDGCAVSAIPSDNFRIATVSTTCRGVLDGEISINTNLSLNYTARLTGTSFSETSNFNTNLILDNLPSGTFLLCITVQEFPDFETCSTVVVDSPLPLSVFSDVSIQESLVTLTMAGSQEYFVTFNESSFKTSQSNLTLQLKEGNNTVKISTGQDCQGIFEETFVMSKMSSIYPNPFNAHFIIRLENYIGEPIDMEIFNVSGQLIKKQLFTETSNSEVEIDTSGLSPGIYIVNLKRDKSEQTFKLVKQ